MLAFLSRTEALVRAAINGWWRPACCVGFVASLWTQGVFVTLLTGQKADTAGLGAMIAATAAAFAVREVGKAWGTAQ